MVLPAPGEIVLYDFRDKFRTRKETGRELKVVQWNIERGYKLNGIIQELKKLDADIIGLQEIDIHCERSGNLDVGKIIAQELALNYAFVCEFEELHSKSRSKRDQGGGVHGNAVLTKFDFSSVEVLSHGHHPVDWEAGVHPKSIREPRRGQRLTLCAIIETPDSLPLVVYSCHLEVFCGISDRLYQFGDILNDSRNRSKAGDSCQLILGDLNTMGNRLARILSLFCTDHLRFKTLGISEASFWNRNLFQVTETSLDDLIVEHGSYFNRRLLFWGLEKEHCKNLINPGFYDPWDPDKDITLQQPKTGPINWNLVTGKLDWILIKDLKVSRKQIGNHDYSFSDHKWLMVHLKPM